VTSQFEDSVQTAVEADINFQALSFQTHYLPSYLSKVIYDIVAPRVLEEACKKVLEHKMWCRAREGHDLMTCEKCYTLDAIQADLTDPV
jgi:hypothetical protein